MKITCADQNSKYCNSNIPVHTACGKRDNDMMIITLIIIAIMFARHLFKTTVTVPCPSCTPRKYCNSDNSHLPTPHYQKHVLCPWKWIYKNQEAWMDGRLDGRYLQNSKFRYSALRKLHFQKSQRAPTHICGCEPGRKVIISPSMLPNAETCNTVRGEIWPKSDNRIKYPSIRASVIKSEN